MNALTETQIDQGLTILKQAGYNAEFLGHAKFKISFSIPENDQTELEKKTEGKPKTFIRKFENDYFDKHYNFAKEKARAINLLNNAGIKAKVVTRKIKTPITLFMMGVED